MIAHVTKLLPLFLVLFNFGHCNLTHDNYPYNRQGHVTAETEDHYVEYQTFTTGDVKFYLFTPDNKTVEITPDNKQLLNMSQPTKIIVHGLGGYLNQFWIDEMVANYHSNGNYNIITVDWSKYTSKDEFYSVSFVNDLGEVVAEFIMAITEENLDLVTDIHLIGTSEGAHVGGATGKKITEKTNKTIDRITGLDPSAPEGNLHVLGEDDANFVDVIHTSQVGYEKNFGTVDFYVTSDNPHALHCNGSCTNTTAPEMFVWTILDANRYQAVSCGNETAYVQKMCKNNTKAAMGEHVPRNVTGTFYLTTDAATALKIQNYFISAITGFLVLFYFI